MYNKQGAPQTGLQLKLQAAIINIIVYLLLLILLCHYLYYIYAILILQAFYSHWLQAAD